MLAACIASDISQRSWIRKVEQGELRSIAPRQGLPIRVFQLHCSADSCRAAGEKIKFPRVWKLLRIKPALLVRGSSTIFPPPIFPQISI